MNQTNQRPHRPFFTQLPNHMQLWTPGSQVRQNFKVKKSIFQKDVNVLLTCLIMDIILTRFVYNAQSLWQRNIENNSKQPFQQQPEK